MNPLLGLFLLVVGFSGFVFVINFASDYGIGFTIEEVKEALGKFFRLLGIVSLFVLFVGVFAIGFVFLFGG